MKKRLLAYSLLTGASLAVLTAPSNGNIATTTVDEYEKFKFETFVKRDSIAKQQYIYEMGQFNHARQDKYNVVYTSRGGAEFERSGGTRAWRNNNPGCIRGGDFARSQGAIGNAGGFAVFPDEKTGMNAICALLRSELYKDKTIAAAINIYAPTFENNTAAYKNQLRFLTGLSLNTKLRDLNDQQLVAVSQAIRQIEGWTPGVEKQIKPDTIAYTALQRTR